ncbi:MAG: FAD-dependent oxidoreductase [Polyangiaceae bacterium]|nr:FAD-dependent oxidoreductase [Polyangiaceae bacterium]
MNEASRRDLLRLLLGAPLAALGCERGLPRRKIPGEIVGGSVDLGHRLRGSAVEQARGAPRRVGVAIVGAGPSGLSAAWRLERQGVTDYVVLELEGQPGGTSAYGTSGVVPYPWGAHYVPVPSRENRALVALLSEMKALEGDLRGEPEALEELIVREPDERLFIDGRWHQGLFPAAGASAEDLADLRRFEAEIARWSRFRDAKGRRAFALPMALSSDAPEVKALDKKSAADFLTEHGVRSQRVRWYVEYATRDDYGLDLAHTSAWAMLFYFCSRGLGGPEGAQFITWPEGNGRLVKHLVEVVGPRLALSQLVTDIVPKETEVELAVYSPDTGLTRYVAEQVILALPKFVAARVVRPLREQQGALGDFSYGAWMVANLHVSRQPKSVGFEQAWDNVIYDSPALGYVVATHQTLRDRGPSVWTYYHPFTDADPKQARERLLAADHAGLVDSILVDLRRAHPDIEDVVERIDVWRWGHAMVRPTPGFIWGASRARAAEPLGRLHFAHSDLSGLALFEEAQYRGVMAADAVLRQRGREPV